MESNDRRSVLKKSGAIASGLLLTSVNSANADEGDGIDEDDYINPPGGGDSTSHSIDRSADSTFPSGSGTSYTAAGSYYNRASDLTWNGERWQVDYHTWAFACSYYELDDGTTGTEGLYRTKHGVTVQHDNEDQISTQAYDDVDWGVSTLGTLGDNLSPESAVTEAASELLLTFGSGVSVIYTVTDLIDKLNESSIGAKIDKMWYLASSQSSMGHHLLYDHTFPPYEDLDEGIITVDLKNELYNSIYKSSTDYTGNREPTDKYDHTFTYNIGVPGNPENMNEREREMWGISETPSGKYVVDERQAFHSAVKEREQTEDS